MNDTAPHTPLDARRTQMNDGRYLIYFTFEESDASSSGIASANSTTVKPEPDARQVATDSAATEAALELIKQPTDFTAAKETMKEGDGNV